MGDHASDVVGGDAATLENDARSAHHGGDRLLVGLAAIHMERVEILLDVFGRSRAGAPAARHVKNVGEISITRHVGRHDAARARAVTKNRRPRAVAKEDTGVAVGPIHDATEFVGANDQDRFVRSGGADLVGDLEAVEKARAGRADIHAGGIFRADESLDMAGGGGEKIIRRDRADENEVDLFGLDPRVFHRGLRGLRGHVACEFGVGGEAALADAGAFDDPLVRGFDHRFQLGIGEHTIGHITARADDGGGSAKLRRDVAQGLFHGVAASPRRCGC